MPTRGRDHERAVREFGDQKEAVVQARARLAALGTPISGALTARRVIDSGSDFGWGISLDGRYAAHARSYATDEGLIDRPDIRGGASIANIPAKEGIYEAIISPMESGLFTADNPTGAWENFASSEWTEGVQNDFKTGKEAKVDWVTPKGGRPTVERCWLTSIPMVKAGAWE